MKKEVREFKDIVEDLYAISESPCFPDDIRNKASNIQYYINNHKEEPIIVQSGNTWVAEYKGVDYLCIDPLVIKPFIDDGILDTFFEKNPIAKSSRWKPISEIEITDEIAKLRPDCVWGDDSFLTLYGIDANGRGIGCWVNDQVDGFNIKTIRLATVKDLKED